MADHVRPNTVAIAIVLGQYVPFTTDSCVFLFIYIGIPVKKVFLFKTDCIILFIKMAKRTRKPEYNFAAPCKINYPKTWRENQ